MCLLLAIIKAWPPDKSEKKWPSDDPLLALNEQKSSLEKNWPTFDRGLKQMILFKNQPFFFSLERKMRNQV